MSYSTLQTIGYTNSSKQALSSSNPAVFGPVFWSYYHIITMHLPENLNPVIADQIRNVILAIPVTVPCDACSLHSGNYMTLNKDKIMALKTGSDFFNFIVDIHNFVNKRLGKRIISYEEARNIWK
jgi:hypothetical protein